MSGLHSSGESAQSALSASLRRHVRATLLEADRHAAAIRRTAENEAARLEQETRARSREALEGVLARMERMVESVEMVEGALRGMTAGLRDDIERLRRDLDGSQDAAVARDESVPPAPVSENGSAAPETSPPVERSLPPDQRHDQSPAEPPPHPMPIRMSEAAARRRS